MVSYIRRLAVTRKHWLSDDDFRHGVALCQAVPGATSMQCAAYVGLRVRGLPGALAGYLGFGLPAFLLMLSLSMAYRRAVQFHVVIAILAGLRALVVALVVNAAWSFGRSSVQGFREAAICLATAVLFYLGGSPFLIIVAAGLAGAVLLRPSQPVARVYVSQISQPTTIWRSLCAPALLLVIGAVLLVSLRFQDRRLAALGLVMMKVDLFAFGGGFSSVPLMFREVVDARGWMSAHVFMDGIALGQVTPGPIVITATFVGHQLAGIAGALVGTASIFLPSLIIVTLAEPWFIRFHSAPVFQRVSQGLVLSFVGLLASVAIHFAGLTPWNAPAGIIATLGLAALICGIDVLWVVLAGAVASALLM
jgi:chromate transporter